MRARRPPERGSRQGRRAAGGRAGLAGERGAAGVAQPQRLAGAGRVGVRGVPMAGARVAAHARAGATAARAGSRPRRRLHGQRHDGHPRDARRLRPLGRLRMPRLVVRRHAALPAADGERRRLRRAALPRGGGPIPVQRLPREAWGPADNALAEAALGLGHPWCDDHNSPTATGVAPFGLNARDGARVTTNDAYLEPARDRPNLRVLGGATVERVLVEAGRATGVRARIDDDCDRSARRGHRAVRRRDPLTRDPAALGHRPRRAGRAAARGPRDAGASAGAVLALPAPGRAARTWTRGRPTASCATPPSSRARARTTC